MKKKMHHFFFPALMAIARRPRICLLVQGPGHEVTAVLPQSFCAMDTSNRRTWGLPQFAAKAWAGCSFWTALFGWDAYLPTGTSSVLTREDFEGLFKHSPEEIAAAASKWKEFPSAERVYAFPMTWLVPCVAAALAAAADGVMDKLELVRVLVTNLPEDVVLRGCLSVNDLDTDLWYMSAEEEHDASVAATLDNLAARASWFDDADFLRAHDVKQSRIDMSAHGCVFGLMDGQLWDWKANSPRRVTDVSDGLAYHMQRQSPDVLDKVDQILDRVPFVGDVLKRALRSVPST